MFFFTFIRKFYKSKVKYANGLFKQILFSFLYPYKDTMLVLGIYGKCMTQTKSKNHTNIHTGIKKTFIKTCIYLIVEQCFSTINKSCTYFD
jgi:hypothetical protein